MKSMGLGRSILFFGIPTSIMIFLFWNVLPVLDQLGKRLFFVFLSLAGGAMLMLLLLALYFYRREKKATGSNLYSRFRLHPMNRRDWLWALGLAMVMGASYILLSFTANWIASVIPYPKIFVRLFDADPNYFMEVKVNGTWWLPFGFLAFAIGNVFGEEFWFRGYILPRQELAFGSRTWIVHGIFWTLFRAFMPWNLIRDLPGALALSYVAQKKQSTSIPMIAHFAQNIPILIHLTYGAIVL